MLIEKKFINRISTFLLPVATTVLFWGCDAQDNQESPLLKNEKTIESKNQSADESLAIETGNAEEKLTIDTHRCIGCGKCVQVAPENFKMSGRKAIIVAEKKSAATTQAINICPVNAISA